MSINTTIYIDESGDPGLAKNSSNFFILAAVVVDETSNMSIQKIIEDFKSKKNWSKNSELKFNKTHKSDIRKILHQLKTTDYEAHTIIIDKRNIQKTKKRSSIYNTALLELLKVINIPSSSIVIDGKAGRKYRRSVGTYLRKNLPFRVSKIKYVESKNYFGVQVADLVAGIFHRKAEQKTDAESFYRLIRPNIKNAVTYPFGKATIR